MQLEECILREHDIIKIIRKDIGSTSKTHRCSRIFMNKVELLLNENKYIWNPMEIYKSIAAQKQVLIDCTLSETFRNTDKSVISWFCRFATDYKLLREKAKAKVTASIATLAPVPEPVPEPEVIYIGKGKRLTKTPRKPSAKNVAIEEATDIKNDNRQSQLEMFRTMVLSHCNVLTPYAKRYIDDTLNKLDENAIASANASSASASASEAH